MASNGLRISLGHRPRGCRRVSILGVRPNLGDYSREAQNAITGAGSVLYPTRLYAQILEHAGKKVFPSARQYYYLGDKIRQTALFDLLDLPHPRTRVYYRKQAGRIYDHFSFPFIAKIPRRIGRGQGVFLIRNETDWADYLSRTPIAYVQEYLPLERDLRVVVMAGTLVVAYWRIIPDGDFRANVSRGGQIDFAGLPREGVDFALEIAKTAGFDDVGLDLCYYKKKWRVIEANMRYGLEGLHAAGLKLSEVIDGLIEAGRI